MLIARGVWEPRRLWVSTLSGSRDLKGELAMMMRWAVIANERTSGHSPAGLVADSLPLYPLRW
jgi:hypothetical protein